MSNYLLYAILLIVLTGFQTVQAEDEAERYFVLGEQQASLGNFLQARQYFERSLQIVKQQNMPSMEGEILYEIGEMDYTLGNLDRASANIEKSFTIARRLKDFSLEAKNLIAFGEIKESHGFYEQAEDHYKRALDIANSQNGNVGLKTSSLNSLGNASLNFGDISAAQAYYEQALKITDNENARGSILANLGRISQTVGDYAQAIAYYTQAMMLLKDSGPTNEGKVLGNLGILLQKLGDYTLAKVYLEKSSTIFKNSANQAHYGQSLHILGALYVDIGEYTQAVEYYIQALENYDRLGDIAGAAQSHASLGDVYLEIGEHQSALAQYKKINSPLRLGIYDFRQSRFSKSLGNLLKGLSKAENSRDADWILSEYIALGLAYEGLKKFATSIEFFHKAVKLIEAQRDKLTPDERRKFLASKVSFFERVASYENLSRVFISAAKPEDALYWAEHTKARLFLEALARREMGSVVSLPEALATHEKDLNEQLRRLLKQADTAFITNNETLIQSLHLDIEKAKQARDDFVVQLRHEQPAYAAVAYPQPLHLEEIKLKPNEVLLEYEVTDSATLAWLVKDGKIAKSLVIPVTREALTKQVKDYREPFHVTKDDIKDGQALLMKLAGFDPKLGKSLYDLLFKDFMSLIQDTDRLVLVPDDILSELPFEALVTEAPDQIQWQNGPHGGGPQAVHYLGDSLSLRYAQSATALVQTRQFRHAAAASGKPLLVVADPVFNLSDDRLKPATRTAQTADTDLAQTAIRGWLAERGGIDDLFRLKKTGESAKLLAELFGGTEQVDILTGFEANEDAVKQRLAQGYRYGVFATHGILANDTPYLQEPALVLSLVAPDGTVLVSEGAGSPGFLTLAEVMSLKIDSELLALTACNTGRGGKGGNLSGEGVMSMGRGFQYAGVESVLMSLWSVEDNSTNLLTEKFFAYLKLGKNKLEALRFARSDLRHEGYEHPYYWAPFILVGEL